jgi:predicted oxidoreductase
MFVPRKKMHKDGPEVSEIIYSLWKSAMDPKGSFAGRVLEKIHTCLDIGITTFDLADIYGNYQCEDLFGSALRESKFLYKRIEIITKCGIRIAESDLGQTRQYYDTTKDHIIHSVENSLEKIGSEKINLLLLHRPDPLMNPNEVAEAFYQLRKSGKVLYFGVMNFSPSQFNMLQSFLDFPLCTNQISISPLNLKPFFDGTLDLCLQKDFHPMAWSPFGGGVLFSPIDEHSKAIRQVLSDYSKIHNATLEEILLAWLTFHPAGILPVLGTNQIERIQIIKDYRKIKITRADWFKIYEVALGEKIS